MSKKARTPWQSKPAVEIRHVVTMDAVSSAEYIAHEDRDPRRVLRDVCLQIDRSQAWGIMARTGYEVLLLLEIMGNIRPYDGGKCVLVERGMMRHKRFIQPHVFYIGDADMLYGNMNVLEYLMFATAHDRADRLSMQEALFELLIDIGLGDISLSVIQWLTPEEKAVVSLIAAAYSGSIMIVINLPEAKFGERLSEAVAKIAQLITVSGKALIIGTMDADLIQKACTHTAFIADGRIVYQGTTADLRYTYDKVAITLSDPDISNIKNKLAEALTGCSLVEKGGRLLIKTTQAPRDICQKILEAGVMPQCIRINEKTVENAYEELITQYDLPEQLF